MLHTLYRDDASASNGQGHGSGHEYEQAGDITIEDSQLEVTCRVLDAGTDSLQQQKHSYQFNLEKEKDRDYLYGESESQSQSQSQSYEAFSQTQPITTQHSTQPIPSGPPITGKLRILVIHALPELTGRHKI